MKIEEKGEKEQLYSSNEVVEIALKNLKENKTLDLSWEKEDV